MLSRLLKLFLAWVCFALPIQAAHADKPADSEELNLPESLSRFRSLRDLERSIRSRKSRYTNTEKWLITGFYLAMKDRSSLACRRFSKVPLGRFRKQFLFPYGHCLFYSNEFGRARSVLSRIDINDAAYQSAQFFLALIAFEVGELEKSEQMLSAVTQLPEYPNLYRVELLQSMKSNKKQVRLRNQLGRVPLFRYSIFQQVEREPEPREQNGLDLFAGITARDSQIDFASGQFARFRLLGYELDSTARYSLNGHFLPLNLELGPGYEESTIRRERSGQTLDERFSFGKVHGRAVLRIPILELSTLSASYSLTKRFLESRQADILGDRIERGELSYQLSEDQLTIDAAISDEKTYDTAGTAIAIQKQSILRASRSAGLVNYETEFFFASLLEDFAGDLFKTTDIGAKFSLSCDLSPFIPKVSVIQSIRDERDLSFPSDRSTTSTELFLETAFQLGSMVSFTPGVGAGRVTRIGINVIDEDQEPISLVTEGNFAHFSAALSFNVLSHVLLDYTFDVKTFQLATPKGGFPPTIADQVPRREEAQFFALRLQKSF